MERINRAHLSHPMVEGSLEESGFSPGSHLVYECPHCRRDNRLHVGDRTFGCGYFDTAFEIGEAVCRWCHRAVLLPRVRMEAKLQLLEVRAPVNIGMDALLEYVFRIHMYLREWPCTSRAELRSYFHIEQDVVWSAVTNRGIHHDLIVYMRKTPRGDGWYAVRDPLALQDQYRYYGWGR